jgi:hypothetical protein
MFAHRQQHQLLQPLLHLTESYRLEDVMPPTQHSQANSSQEIEDYRGRLLYKLLSYGQLPPKTTRPPLCISA